MDVEKRGKSRKTSIKIKRSADDIGSVVGSRTKSSVSSFLRSLLDYFSSVIHVITFRLFPEKSPKRQQEIDSVRNCSRIRIKVKTSVRISYAKGFLYV